MIFLDKFSLNWSRIVMSDIGKVFRMGLQLQNEGIFTHFDIIVWLLGDDKVRPYTK